MANKKKRRNVRPKAARALIILAVLGIGLYVALATKAGNYVAENVIAPIFQKLNGESDITAEQISDDPVLTPALVDTEDSSDTNTENTQSVTKENLSLTPDQNSTQDDASVATSSIQTNLDSSTGSMSEEIHIEAYTAYALQLGAFSTEDNANNAAEESRVRGAAGYVFQDGHYRVLAAVYNTQDDAKKVKDQLLQDNEVDSSIYIVQAPAAALRVTASESGLAAVKEAFEVIQTAREKLYEMCTSIDRGQLTEQEVRDELQNLAEQVRIPLTALEGAGVGDMGTWLLDELTETADELEKVAAMQETGTEFSVELKYAHVRQTCAFAELMKKITTQQ